MTTSFNSFIEAGEWSIIDPIIGEKLTIPAKKNIKSKHNHAEIILKKLPAINIIIFLIKFKFSKEPLSFGTIFVLLNIDSNPEIPQAYNVKGIPTLLFFNNKQFKGKIVGNVNKESILEKLKILELYPPKAEVPM